jgi:hypothetical protein
LRKQTTFLLIVGLLMAASNTAFAVTHSSRKKVRRFHRRIVWNPLVRGSHDSLVRQNEEIDRLGLPRIEDDAQLEELEARNELVQINESESLRVAGNLEPSRRYCKPWTLTFLQDLGDAYFSRFHTAIQVNSAVRTVQQQKKLRRHNRNAAPIDGDTASSHLAGTSVDLAKRGLSKKQKQWLGEYLKNLIDQGLIEAAEERRQACFHVMVVEKYATWRDQQLQQAQPAALDEGLTGDGGNQ